MGIRRSRSDDELSRVFSSFYPSEPPLLLMATGPPRHPAAASIVTTFTDIYTNFSLKYALKCLDIK